VLAFVLLGALAVTGWRMAASVPMAALAPTVFDATGGKNRNHNPMPPPAAGPQAQEGPGWADLNAQQQQALAPLAERWPLLNEVQKRGWLKLAEGFAARSPEDRARIQARIADWASLSARQRSQARLNYAAASRLDRSIRRAQWEAYQTLDDAEKKRLAAKAGPRPAGASIPVRPVAPRKLVRVPAANASAALNPPKILPPAEFHAPQPHPAAAPESAAVETAPVQTPSAIGVPLPSLSPEDTPPAPADNPSSSFYTQ
jgi:hypothetical protein